jgi:hypothetical protein
LGGLGRDKKNRGGARRRPRAAPWPPNGEAKLFKEMGDARCSQPG